MTTSAAPSPYVTSIQVRFADCDPAGIVFYPRYFEMFNSLVEDWLVEGLGTSFGQLVMERGIGLPTAHLETDFRAASRLGERLQASLRVTKAGRTSLGLALLLAGPDGSERVRSSQVLVFTDTRSGKPIPVPEELRERIGGFYCPDEAAGNSIIRQKGTP